MTRKQNPLKWKSDAGFHQLKPETNLRLLRHPWIKKHFGSKAAELYHGVHTATRFDIAACYAFSTTNSMKRHDPRAYPVVFEIDVTGLEPYPDVDALMVIADSFDAGAIADLAKTLAKHEGSVADASQGGWFDDFQGEVSPGDDACSGIFEGHGRGINIFETALDVYGDDDKAREMLERFIETKDMPVELAAALTTQKRYLADIYPDRIIAVHAIQPVWPYILDDPSGMDDDEMARLDRIESAGYQLVTLENYQDLNFAHKPVYDSGREVNGEFHGTASTNAREAMPELNLPEVSPYPQPDKDFNPDDVPEEDEDE